MSNEIIAKIACPVDGHGNAMGISVGHDGVARIEREEENMGNYQIIWYVAYNDSGEKIGMMNAVTVQTVVFRQEVNRDPEESS